jgi:hypothetical protein
VNLRYAYRASVDTVADATHDPRDNHLHILISSSLENGADDHDPSSPHQTAFPSKLFGSDKGNNASHEATNVIDGGEDPLQVGAGVIELFSK